MSFARDIFLRHTELQDVVIFEIDRFHGVVSGSSGGEGVVLGEAVELRAPIDQKDPCEKTEGPPRA